MPESRSRKKAAQRPAKPSRADKPAKPPRESRAERRERRERRGGGRWVAPVMLTLLLVGLAWIVVFYLAGSEIPGMADLGYWNLAIGMGCILGGLIAAMKWE